jgi:hypothetical protein
VDQGLEGVASPGADVVVRGLGLAIADSEVFEPAFDLVSAVSQLVADRGGLGADSAKDQIAGEDTGGDDEQQDNNSAQAAWQPMTLEQGDQLPRHRRDHPGDDQRDDDHLGQRQQPDDAREEHHDAHQEPGGEPRVAQPARCGEEAGELGRIDLDELISLLALAGAAEAAKATANHRPVPFMDDHLSTRPRWTD